MITIPQELREGQKIDYEEWVLKEKREGTRRPLSESQIQKPLLRKSENY